MPQGFAQPASQALLPDYQRNGYFVGNEWIGEGEQLLSLLPPLQRTRRMRGKDVVKRSRRRCALCLENGRDDDAARACCGRNVRKKCGFYVGL